MSQIIMKEQKDGMVKVVIKELIEGYDHICFGNYSLSQFENVENVSDEDDEVDEAEKLTLEESQRALLEQSIGFDCLAFPGEIEKCKKRVEAGEEGFTDETVQVMYDIYEALKALCEDVDNVEYSFEVE